MGTLLDSTDRSRILDRLGRLTPERPAEWGRFSAPQMICHVNIALQQGLGGVRAGPPRGPLRHPPVNWLVIHVLPWPKGRAKSPAEFLTGTPSTWADDVAAVRAAIEEYGTRNERDAWPLNPVFGRISGRSWGALQYKHLDHHLRQFGV